MIVRATADGTYGGYPRVGPIIAENQKFDGEVFEISDVPFPITDMDGKPVLERDEEGKVLMVPETDKSGKPVLGKDGKARMRPKIKMGTWFTPEWMVKVSDDTPITFDYPPFELPGPYRKPRISGASGPVIKPVTQSTSVI